VVNDKPKVLVEHDPAEGVHYYRQNDTENVEATRLPLGMIDWLALAKQKQALLKVVWNDENHPLWGLVHLIDKIQDEADQQDFPVVWSTAEWEDT